MYYADLTYYRDGGADSEDAINIYPKVINVGWLDKGMPYVKGSISDDLVRKLKDVTFLDLRVADERKRGVFDKKAAVLVHLMHVRGAPHPCPFCSQENGVISLKPDGQEVYKGDREMVLGKNEICIPSVRKGYFFSFPTMLYHYVVEHGYLPPAEFLESVEQFDLTVPYDIDEGQSDLECMEVSPADVETNLLYRISE